MQEDSLNLKTKAEDPITEVFFDDRTKEEKKAFDALLKSIPTPQTLSIVMLNAGDIPVFINDDDIDNYTVK